MRDSGDFPDSESLIEEARFAYSEIYHWHTTQGKRRFIERFKERQESAAWRTKYVALLAELVKPKKATVRDMLHVAREVLSGQMEWAYHEKSEQGVTLSNWARRIEELLEERRKRLEEREKSLAREKAAKNLNTFKNLSADGSITDGVRIEIPLQENESWSVDSYLAYANSAYHDVRETDNIGGKTFLIQTNLERTHDSRTGYTFYNVKLLHVETIAGENNLVELVRNGALSVEAVVLGE